MDFMVFCRVFELLGLFYKPPIQLYDTTRMLNKSIQAISMGHQDQFINRLKTNEPPVLL